MEKKELNVIGYWMSEKKSQKVNWNEFEDVCKTHGYVLKKIDLEKPLESYGLMKVFLHKLTDIIALANQGEAKSTTTIDLVDTYISKHPDLIVVDPLDNVRLLLDRYRCYSIIDQSELFHQGVFTPSFAEITTTDVAQIRQKLKTSDVSYPFVCKPIVGHGSKQAHEMSVIFNEQHLSDCKPPCVAQSFINHNAILYKIFIVGAKHHVVERPSLKNFYPSGRDTIFFESSDVSKAGSQSSLSVLDEDDETAIRRSPEPNPEIFDQIADTLRKAFNMNLLGVDVVIENDTGKYAIIDVNAYPGYDGFPDFYKSLLMCINELVQTNAANK